MNSVDRQPVIVDDDHMVGTVQVIYDGGGGGATGI